jgi:tight adherence protein B
MAEPAYAAALCAAALALLAVRRPGGPRRARLPAAGGGAVDGRRDRIGRRLQEARARREWLCLPAGLLLAVLGGSLLPLIAGAIAVPVLRRRLTARKARRRRQRRAEAVIALCAAVAGELRAGLQPGQALLAAAEAGALPPDTGPGAVAAARFGGDVPGALREAAAVPGAEGLAGMAACWRVSVDGGAGLAAGLDRLEAALRAERDREEDLAAQLSGARATVALLALLPAVALAMGWAMGADPLRVLLHTPAGLACLLAGVLLETAGLWWAARIVRSAA